MPITTKTTEEKFSGTGSQTAFTFTIEYLKTSDLKVYIGTTLKTENTLGQTNNDYTISGTQLTFNTAPASGTNNITITRSTEIDTARAVYAAGSSIRSIDLNNNQDQLLFSLQESQNAGVASASQAGSMSATDKVKLDGIETGATADQTAAEIRTLVESATDSNVFTDADHTKLNSIETGATADQTAAEIRTLVESATDSNVFTDADHTKLNAIEASATADQTAAEIRTLVESASDSNVFTDADHSKLNAIEASADVTDATNVDAAGAVMNSDTSTAAMSFVVDEDNMSSNSATKLPTQQSVKAYVDTEVAGVVDSAPGALNTLNELASALGDDANFSTTVTNNIATKLPLAGGTMTGNIVMSGSQTVDGRDLSVDGSKLDGIETGAINSSNTAITNKLPLAGGTLTGNLGIGITPSRRFTVAAESGQTIIELRRTNTNTGGALGTISFTASDGHSVGSISSIGDGDNEGGNIIFRTTSDAADNDPYDAATPIRFTITSGGNLQVPDNGRLQLGDSQDLEIYHDSNNSVIDNNTGDFYILSAGAFIFQTNNNENAIKCVANGSVELYEDAVKRFETKNYGALIHGALVATSDVKVGSYVGKLIVGTSNEFTIQHDDTDTFIENTTGNLHIRPKASEEGIKLIPDGNIEMYHDNVKKAEVVSNGLNIEGTVTCDDILVANTIKHEGQTNTKIEFDTTVIKFDSNGVTRLQVHPAALFVQAGYKLAFIATAGENPYIRSTGTDNRDLEIGQGSDSMAQFKRDGAVELYFDGGTDPKLATTSTGVSVTGDVRTTGDIVLNATGLDIYTSNGALIANDSDGAFATARSGNNIDHIWHDDGNDSWNFVSDSTYKSKGNTNINVGSINGNSFTTFKYHGAAGDGTTDDSTAVTNALATGNIVNGDGKIYVVTSLPTDFKNIRNAAFKIKTGGSVNNTIYPTKDFLTNNTAKITNNRAYTAWTQDKAYVVNNQIKVWSNFGDAHYDGIKRPICFISDDGGNSYPETTLLDDPSEETLEAMSAGTDGIYEYVFATKYPNGTSLTDSTVGTATNPKKISHLMYRRPVAVERYEKDVTTSISSNTITLTNHGYGTGLKVKYTGSTVTNLTSGNSYFVVRVNANTFKLASTLKNAESNTTLTISSSGSFKIDPDASTYQRWQKFVYAPAWANDQAYEENAIIQNSSKLYQAQAAISSGGSAPTHSSGTTNNWKRVKGTPLASLPNSPFASSGGLGNVRTTFQHSFAAGNDYIVTGATNGAGAFILYSNDHGLTWNKKGLKEGTNFEEPTVRYDSGTSNFYAFTRAGDTGGQIVFYVIPHALNTSNLSSSDYHEAGTFFDPKVIKSPVPFVVKDGYVHAFLTERGTNDDPRPESFYVKYQLSNGSGNNYNIWAHAELYNIGSLLQLEKGSSASGAAGASGTGVGSACVYEDKIIFFYSSEERSQSDISATSEDGIDKIVNLYQFVLGDKVKHGATNYKDNLIEDRSSAYVPKLIPNAEPDGKYADPSGSDTDRQTFWHQNGNHIFSTTRSFSDSHLNSRTDSDFGGYTTETGKQLAAFDSFNEAGEVSIFGDIGSGESLGFTVYNTDNGGGTGFLVNSDQSLNIISNGQSKLNTVSTGCVINGRLGLGTETAPSFPLDIKGPDNTLAYLESTDQHAYILMKDSIGNILIGTDSGHFRLSQTDTNGTIVETLRIKADGKVGIGTTNPSSKVEIRDSSATHQLISINRPNSDVAALYIGNNSSNQPIIAANNNDLLVGRDNGGTFTEYYRVNNSSGHIQIHQSSSTEPGAGNTTEGACFNRDSDDGTCLYLSKTDAFCLHLNRVNSGDIQIFRRQGIQKGQININASQVAYETTSDYRLKENVVSISDGISKLKALKPSRFNFKEDPTNTIDGFLAHEVQTVVPNAVSGTKDGVDENGNPKYQGMDSSLLVPLLTAALQEAVAKIETLETKVAALEAA